MANTSDSTPAYTSKMSSVATRGNPKIRMERTPDDTSFRAKSLSLLGGVVNILKPCCFCAKAVSRTSLVFRDNSLRFFKSDPLLAPIRKVRHMRRNRRLVTELNWGIRSFAAAHAVDPVGHVILVLALPRECSSMRPVHVFRIVSDKFSLFATGHLGPCPSMLDRAIAS